MTEDHHIQLTVDPTQGPSTTICSTDLPTWSLRESRFLFLISSTAISISLSLNIPQERQHLQSDLLLRVALSKCTLHFPNLALDLGFFSKVSVGTLEGSIFQMPRDLVYRRIEP